MAASLRSKERREWTRQFGRMPEPDVVDLLLEQHTLLRDTMAEIAVADGARRAELWTECVALLTRHEEGEQLMIHPNAAEDDRPGEPSTRDRLEEEAEAMSLLAEFDGIDPASDEFLHAFMPFREAVMRHAVREQRYEFNRLRHVYTEESLAVLRDDLLEFQGSAAG